MNRNVEPKQEKRIEVEASAVGGLVRHIWWYRPWNIVRWVYTESDDIGLSVLKAENTTYLFKALFLGAFLWFINLLIAFTGIPHNKSGFFIFDA